MKKRPYGQQILGMVWILWLVNATRGLLCRYSLWKFEVDEKTKPTNTHIPKALPHTRLIACDHYTSSTLIGSKRRGGSKFVSHYARGTNIVDECKMDKSLHGSQHDSNMASHGSCFMATWTIFKNHLLEVGLTPNRETMLLRTLMTVDLFHSITCEDPHT